MAGKIGSWGVEIPAKNVSVSQSPTTLTLKCSLGGERKSKDKKNGAGETTRTLTRRDCW